MYMSVFPALYVCVSRMCLVPPRMVLEFEILDEKNISHYARIIYGSWLIS